MSLSHPARSLVLVACVGLVLGVVVWASTTLRPRQQQTTQELNVKVQNKTAALKIINTRKVGDGFVADLEVVLMNQSDKTVLAYTFSSGESGVTSFGLNLEPGDSKTEKIPVANLRPSAEDKSVSYLRLSAVYLEDGSSQGEKLEVGRLNSRMLGIQEEANSELDALRKASSSGVSDPQLLAKTVEENIASTSVARESSDLASERLAGRAYVKEKISREINEIRSNKHASERDVREQLEALILSVQKLSGGPRVKQQENK